jgi:hypothetical protein
MEPYTVVLSPSPQRTRVLLTRGPDEFLRASLPPPVLLSHERALRTLLEGLALVLDQSLRVVLSVDARDAGCCLGLTDEWGLGQRSLYYEVEVVGRRVRHRRGRRLRGVDNFADLRPLRLETECAAAYARALEDQGR